MSKANEFTVVESSEGSQGSFYLQNVPRFLIQDPQSVATTSPSAIMPQIPDIPGNLVARYSDQDRWLKAEVSRMCGVDPDRCVLGDGFEFS